MEDYGKLRVRYYVIKTSGIFAKNGRILEIYDQGLIFLNPNVSKACKDREVFYFKDPMEFVLSDRNEKDFQVKAGKQSFVLTCSKRTRLLTDLHYYKDLWDIRHGCGSPSKVREIAGLMQVDLSDLSSKIPISLRLLRSILHITCHSREEEKETPFESEEYIVRYMDIEAVMMLPTGFLIDKKNEYVKLVFDNDSVDTITDIIRTVPRKTLGLSIPIKTEYSYLEKKVIDVEEYSVTTTIRCPGNIPKEIRVHVDANSILEESVSDNRILRVQNVSSLFAIKVKRKGGNVSTLKLYFQKGVMFEYILKSNELDYLLSNIMSSVLSKEDDAVPVIIREKLPLQAKVHGIGFDSDGVYEGTLAKYLCELYTTGDPSSEILNRAILEAALNTCLKGQSYDYKFMQILFSLASEYAKELGILEADNNALVEYNECLELGQSYPGNQKGKALLALYRRLPPLLGLIRLYLSLRSSLPGLPVFQKQLDTLLSLTESKESVVSFMASLSLRKLLKLNKSTERRLETSGKKWVIKECNVIGRVFELLSQFVEKSPEDFFSKFFFNDIINDCPYLHIYGLLSVFEVILMEKREGTLSEDVAYVVDSIINNDYVLDMVEQFTMYNSKPIIYQASLITAQTLLLIFNCSEKGKFSNVQPKILESTMLLLWHVQLLFASSSVRQKNLSASVAALTLFGNIETCALMARVFPRTMLKKVDAEKRYTEWEPTHWKEFFTLLQNNYNTVTEQWNEECREELVAKLRAIVIAYLKQKYKEKRLKWNYEEFDVIYACLENKCLVGRYYLSELVLFDEHSVPYLKEHVVEPLAFWNKLVTKFLAARDKEVQKLVLNAIMLVYRDYSEAIKECEVLSYFLYLLERNESKHLHLDILKLVLATVKAKGMETFKANYNIILRADGLTTMSNILCKAYRKYRGEDREEFMQICCYIVKILGRMLKRKDKLQVFPDSKVKNFCKQRECLSAILQLLLIRNTALRKAVIKFIRQHFTVPCNVSLKETGMVDMLMKCVDESTGLDALQLLLQLQENIETFNDDLDLSAFSEVDQELIKGSPKIRTSVFLRFFPVCFTRYLVDEVHIKNALAIYLNDEFVKPTLIWTKDMKSVFINSIKAHFKGFKQELRKFAEDPGATIEEMLIYKERFNAVIKYATIDKEIRCEEYFLRPWIKFNASLEDKSPGEFFAALGRALKSLVESQKPEKLEELTVILKAFDILFPK